MNRRALFLTGLLVELLAVFGLFLPPLFLLRDGTEIALRTMPVDPRSIFRGDYVTLDYEIGDLGQAAWQEGGEARPVIVALEKKGEFHERAGIVDDASELKPGQLCIRGIREYGRIRFPDIAQYFVEEETGREFEDATRAHRLIVDAVVDAKCRAAIKGVRLGPEVPPDEAEKAGLGWMREPVAAPER